LLCEKRGNGSFQKKVYHEVPDYPLISCVAKNKGLTFTIGIDIMGAT
jgi:hypothetical protein